MMTQEIRAQLGVDDSALQRNLTQYARARVTAAEKRWTQRHAAWREAEALYRTYRPADEQDKITRNQPLTDGVQKIVVPYSYSVVQSMVAFFMTILTDRIPLVPIRGNGPKDVAPAQLMEEVLYWQMQNMEPQWLLTLYQWLLDAHRYGLGVVKSLYTVREWVDVVRRFRQATDPFTGAMTTVDEVVEEDVVAYEGNEAMIVAPFDFLPDPARPVGEFQRGEFVFHRMRRSRTELMQKEAQGVYTGIALVKRDGERTDAQYQYGTSLPAIGGMSDFEEGDEETDIQRQPYVTIHEGWCWIDPEAMGKLGLIPEGEPPPRTPRLWVLTLANRSRVIRAEAAQLPGRRFPFEIYETNYDLHSPGNPGVIESIAGLNYHLSWLFNSRMQNVRKTLNNEWVVDPSLIEMRDVEDPEPGKLIRLTRAAQNAGLLSQAVMPMPVTDVTANHHTDAKVVQEIAEQVTGASRLLMGLPNTGRRSASEVQGQLSLSSGRMKMMAEVFVCQGYRPLVGSMVKNTQVFMSNSLNERLRTALAGVLGADTPDMVAQLLQGDFTYPILEGGMPSDRMIEQNVLREIIQTGMQTGAAAPLLQQLNWTALYKRFLEVLGVRNFADYVIQVTPDQQVQAQAQQGNLVGQEQMPMEPQVASDGFPQAPNMMAP